jgi:hypothetical protein
VSNPLPVPSAASVSAISNGASAPR